jgi:signal transduction histidine kinase
MMMLFCPRGTYEHGQRLRGLLPVQVEAEGLMVALHGLAQRTDDFQNVQCVFECVAPVPVASNAVATHLFRIAQEGVQNAIKHARAKRIVITLANSKGVTLPIRDNGIGIPADARRDQGNGLCLMAYRARIIGAQLSVEPARDSGTIVRCVISPAALAGSQYGAHHPPEPDGVQRPSASSTDKPPAT